MNCGCGNPFYNQCSCGNCNCGNNGTTGCGYIQRYIPFVSANFVAPALNTGTNVAVTTLQGLKVGTPVEIGGAVYDVSAFVDANTITIFNSGSGLTPNTVVVAKDSATNCYQYPITASPGLYFRDYSPELASLDINGNPDGTLSSVNFLKARVAPNGQVAEAEIQVEFALSGSSALIISPTLPDFLPIIPDPTLDFDFLGPGTYFDGTTIQDLSVDYDLAHSICRFFRPGAADFIVATGCVIRANFRYPIV